MSRVITELLRRAADQPDVVSFAGGLPAPRTFPRRLLRAAACRAVDEGAHDALQYDWPEGRPRLRAQIAARLAARGVDVEPDEVVMTNGAQEAIALAVEIIGPRQVQVDEATYSSALELFHARGARPVTHRARVRYLMPVVGNPCGWGLTPAEREAALEAEHVIEDDAYADLRFEGPPPPPLLGRARARVWHVGSVSKTLSPGLRVGWLVPPRRYRKRVVEAKAQRDIQAGGLAQSIVEHFLASTDFEARLARLRHTYARRARALCALVEAVPQLEVRRPEGGFSLWVRTPVMAGDTTALAQAVEAGVAFEPGGLFWSEPQRRRPLWMRLNYSAGPQARFAEGIERLVGVLDRLQRARAAG